MPMEAFITLNFRIVDADRSVVLQDMMIQYKIVKTFQDQPHTIIFQTSDQEFEIESFRTNLIGLI